MPELPDLRILSEAFGAALVGRPLLASGVPQPLVLRGTQAELRAMHGATLAGVTQRGKYLMSWTWRTPRIVVNAMLTGRLGLAAPGSKPFSATGLVLTFGPRRAGP